MDVGQHRETIGSKLANRSLTAGERERGLQFAKRETERFGIAERALGNDARVLRQPTIQNFSDADCLEERFLANVTEIGVLIVGADASFGEHCAAASREFHKPLSSRVAQ